MDDKILLTIAARKGSKGVKNKNLRKLCGKPLIAHTVCQAVKWGNADHIVCTTDSEQIAQVAKKYGAEIPFMRPASLAGDKIGKIPVLRHALVKAEVFTKKRFDIVIDLDTTAPIRKLSDIDNALEIFRQTKAKSVFSVTECRKNPYFNMVEADKRGFFRLVKQGDLFMSRQASPKVYDLNASIYVYARDYLLDSATLGPISDRSSIVLMDEWSAFDIDKESDFQFIEFLVKKGIAQL